MLMKSTLKFKLEAEGSRSLQPVIMVQCYHNDDARDEIASNFSYRRGLNHNFLTWERVNSYNPTEVSAGQLVGEFVIKNYKPDSDLVVLDASSIIRGSEDEKFYSDLRELCSRHKVLVEYMPDGRHVQEEGTNKPL